MLSLPFTLDKRDTIIDEMQRPVYALNPAQMVGGRLAVIKQAITEKAVFARRHLQPQKQYKALIRWHCERLPGKPRISSESVAFEVGEGEKE